MVASREKVLCLYCWLCWRRPTNFPTPKTDSSRFPAAGFALRVAWASTPVPRLMPNATKPPTAGSWSPSHHRSPAPPQPAAGIARPPHLRPYLCPGALAAAPSCPAAPLPGLVSHACTPRSVTSTWWPSHSTIQYIQYPLPTYTSPSIFLPHNAPPIRLRYRVIIFPNLLAFPCHALPRPWVQFRFYCAPRGCL